MLLNILQEIVHQTNLSVIENIKITGNDEATYIDAKCQCGTIVIKGKFNNPIESFNGEFGIGQLSFLKSLTNFANYKSEKSTITVTKRDDGNPEQIIFVDEQGQSDIFRLMPKDLVPSIPTLGKMDWLHEFTPTKGKISELSTKASMYSKQHSEFIIKSANNDLRFYIGDEGSTTNRGFTILDKNVTTVSEQIKVPMSLLLNVFSLNSNTDILMSISKKCVKLSIKNVNSEWDYIIPTLKGK